MAENYFDAKVKQYREWPSIFPVVITETNEYTRANSFGTRPRRAINSFQNDVKAGCKRCCLIVNGRTMAFYAKK